MQLKVGDSTEPKIPTLQLCPKTEDIGELQTQNSTCHIQVEHAYMYGSCASAEGVWQWLNQV